MGRKGLHERSNSKNNELPFLTMGPKVSTREDAGSASVSKRTPATAAPKTRSISGGSKPPRTPTSINTTTSMESLLPPVPPLVVTKIPPLAIKKEGSRGSVSTTRSSILRSTPPPRPSSSSPSARRPSTGLEQFFHAPSQSSRPSIYIDTVARHASNASRAEQRAVAAGSSAEQAVIHEQSEPPTAIPPQPPHASTPSPAPLLTGPRPTPTPPLKTPSPPQKLKPILKRTKQNIPPFTVEDYDERRSSWVERTLEQRYNFTRMNGRSQTLRMVRTEEEEEALDEFNEILPAPSRPLQSVSPTHSISPESTVRHSVKKKSSFASIISRSDSLRGAAVNIPQWARYFYSKDEVSLPEEDPNGAMSEKPKLTRMPSAHIPPPRSSHGPAYVNDPAEVASRWSYPHLERTYYPLSPVERIKNRQLALFCLGFILPFCWMIAAFLPLPGPRPMWKAPVVSGGGIGPGGGRNSYQVDVEATMNCTWEEERKFLGHEYWRKVNRCMAVVGVLITGAVVALAVVSVKL
ncbi:hypothetical protein DFH27DRAFT_390614 [Peziza echinospora]|nr:hypothetical protein DFH27DRAFT_390614 [Peziza echinospora]